MLNSLFIVDMINLRVLGWEISNMLEMWGIDARWIMEQLM